MTFKFIQQKKISENDALFFFLVKSANHNCVFPVRLSIIKLYEKYGTSKSFQL